MNKKFSKYPRQYKFAWLINYAKVWEANRFWKTDSCRNGAIQIRKSNSKANFGKQPGEKMMIIYRNTKLQHEFIWKRIFCKYEFSISMTKECESHELFSFSAFEWEKAGFLSAAPVSQAWIYLGAPSVFPSPPSVSDSSSALQRRNISDAQIHFKDLKTVVLSLTSKIKRASFRTLDVKKNA